MSDVLTKPVVILCDVCEHSIPGASKQRDITGITPVFCPTCQMDQERLMDDLDHYWMD